MSLIQSLSMMMGISALSMGSTTIKPTKVDERPSYMLDPEPKKLDKEYIADKQAEHNGLQKFTYGPGRHVHAINQRNADRKAAKKGWI